MVESKAYLDALIAGDDVAVKKLVDAAPRSGRGA